MDVGGTERVRSIRGRRRQPGATGPRRANAESAPPLSRRDVLDYFSRITDSPENAMHDHAYATHADRYVPFKQEGWGIALFIVLLAVAARGLARRTCTRRRTCIRPIVRLRADGVERLTRVK